jgi:hypothetical protein
VDAVLAAVPDSSPVSFANAACAIGALERALVTSPVEVTSRGRS